MLSIRFFTATLFFFGAVAFAQENNERPMRRLRSLHKISNVAEQPKNGDFMDEAFANRELMSRVLLEESMSM